MKINFLFVFIFLLSLFKISSAQQKQYEDIFRPFVFVELFSSEGCSNCPPADSLLKVLKDYATKNELPIYIVDYHVQLWDDQGWVDPFGTPEFSLRHENYTAVLKQDDLYTPEMVVNGQKAFIGSDDIEADNAISVAIEQPASFLIDMTKDSVSHDTIYISYHSSRADSNFSVTVLLIEDGLKSEIKGGENQGMTVYHENVCRISQSITLNNKRGQIKTPLHKVALNKNFSMIGFVQQRQTFKIVGACAGDM